MHVFRWLFEMTGMPRGHIYESTLLQSADCVWSLDPSYSTGIVNGTGGATCFSSTAIYKTPTLRNGAAFGPATDIYIYFVAGASLQEMTGKWFWEFPS